MAEKITLEEYEKRKKEGKTVKNEKNKLLWSLRIFIFLFAITGIVLGILIFYYSGVIKEKNEDIEFYKERADACSYQTDYKSQLNYVLGDKEAAYVKNKLDFIDNNIVFVIEGYGNYYYSYDCMQQKVNGPYTYWAYNIEAARAKGYYDGGCN